MSNVTWRVTKSRDTVSWDITSRHTRGGVIITYINEQCHAYDDSWAWRDVTCSHVTSQSRDAYEGIATYDAMGHNVMAHIRKSRYHIYKWVTSLIWWHVRTSHVTRMKRSQNTMWWAIKPWHTQYHTYKWVMSHIWWHTYERIMSVKWFVHMCVIICVTSLIYVCDNNSSCAWSDSFTKYDVMGRKVMAHVRRGRITRIHESCHAYDDIYEWAM